MTFSPLLPLLLALALPVHAQVYKCTQDGKVTYSEAPCAHGTQRMLDVPPPPAAPADAQGELRRLQQQAQALQDERLAREERQAHADAQADRLAARRREKCARLQLERKWADEDARRAPPQAEQAARLKARRAGERYAAECA